MEILRLVGSRKAERFESAECPYDSRFFMRKVPYIRVTSTCHVAYVSDEILPFQNHKADAVDLGYFANLKVLGSNPFMADPD